MPIYAYKCSACGHAADALQKMSDDPLTVCPACGQSTYQKQVTAAGFALKGSGWYVTDFRGGGTAEKKTSEPAVSGAATGGEGAVAASSATAAPATPASAPAAAAATPATQSKPSSPSASSAD